MALSTTSSPSCRVSDEIWKERAHTDFSYVAHGFWKSSSRKLDAVRIKNFGSRAAGAARH